MRKREQARAPRVLEAIRYWQFGEIQSAAVLNQCGVRRLR